MINCRDCLKVRCVIKHKHGLVCMICGALQEEGAMKIVKEVGDTYSFVWVPMGES